MSSHLFNQLAALAAETRHSLHTDGKFIVEKLTVVVGYGHLAECHPHLRPILERHLEEFMDLACNLGYPDLCSHSGKILQAMRRTAEFKDAA